MGLTIHYDWKTRADASTARRLVSRFHTAASKLPFDSVSPIFEQDPPDGDTRFELYDHPFREGGIYLSRKRDDGEEEVVSVPAQHAVFFVVHVEGAETATIGLASHPPVVVHREDVILRDEEGNDRGRHIGQGAPIEFPTRRRGYYSWHSFCKTQYASNPKLGGESNFLKAHLSLIELFDQITAMGPKVRVRDDSSYARHRDVDRLLQTLRDWNGLVATVVGRLSDELGEEAGGIVAPIREHPDFEHLEMKGMEVIKRLAARQRSRKKKPPKKPDRSD